MRLLDKKQVNQEIQNQKGQQMREGIALAQKVDTLRETKALEEKRLKEWRDKAIKTIQQEIDDYITVRDNLQNQTEEAEVYRKKLIEPLDKEWEEINAEKALIIKEKETIRISKLSIIEQTGKVKIDLKKVSDVIARLKTKENETEKIQKHTVSLHEMAKEDRELARRERIAQTESHENKMLGLSQKEKEYEVALTTIQIRENAAKEKELELITRENHLATQQRTLKIAYDEIHKKT